MAGTTVGADRTGWTGERVLAASWDRSPGGFVFSSDGRTVYAYRVPEGWAA